MSYSLVLGFIAALRIYLKTLLEKFVGFAALWKCNTTLIKMREFIAVFVAGVKQWRFL